MSDFGKVEADVHINATAEQFHEIFSGRTHHFANISADKVKSVDMHEGDWGKEGSIIVWNYVHDGKQCVAKEVVEKIDPQKNLITFKVIEGDILEQYKSFKATLQVSSKDKGSLVHWVFEYEKLHGEIPDPHSLLQFAVELSKDLDAHLNEGQNDQFGRLETDVIINASAEHFHEILSNRTHHISNVSDKIKAVTMHNGEWGKEGSVIVWNYVHDGKHCVAKELIEKVDPSRNLITFKVTEGDLLEHFKSFKVTMQVTPQNKGSLVHWIFEYEKLHGEIPDPHSLVQLATEMSQDIDAHLSQN